MEEGEGVPHVVEEVRKYFLSVCVCVLVCMHVYVLLSKCVYLSVCVCACLFLNVRVVTLTSSNRCSFKLNFSPLPSLPSVPPSDII